MVKSNARGRATHRALIDAALALFAERGYHNVTTEQIAEQAGTTQQTLYRHFDAKADLVVWPVDSSAFFAALEVMPLDVSVADAILGALAKEVESFEESAIEVDRQRQQIISQTPELARRLSADETHLEVRLAAWLATRLEGDERLARCTAGALVGLRRSCLAEYVADGSVPFVELVETAMGGLQTFFRPDS